MIIDLGTGDGRAVLARAAAEPRTFVIGVDAATGPMAESSRRAQRARRSNALFLAEGVEALSDVPWLHGVADLVTVTFPWGSLLRGVLGLDTVAPDVMPGAIAALLRDGARVEVLASVIPSDGLAGLAGLDRGHEATVRDAWAAAGLCLEAMRPATVLEIRASGSSWGRRLGAGRDGRPVWRLDGTRVNGRDATMRR